MITRDLVALIGKDSPHLTLSVVDREQGERWVPGGDSEHYRLESVPSCLCCGEPAWDNRRCTKHQGRTPCVVEGCRRTTARFTIYFVCGEHWKAYVPPGSPERRVLNRLARLAKKLGYSKTERWPDDLEVRWWRTWASIAARVQRRSTEGQVDEREIRKMFGWEEDDNH